MCPAPPSVTVVRRQSPSPVGAVVTGESDACRSKPAAHGQRIHSSAIERADLRRSGAPVFRKLAGKRDWSAFGPAGSLHREGSGDAARAAGTRVESGVIFGGLLGINATDHETSERNLPARCAGRLVRWTRFRPATCGRLEFRKARTSRDRAGDNECAPHIGHWSSRTGTSPAGRE
jgi:hypothetical protein